MTSQGKAGVNEPLIHKNQLTVSHIYKLLPDELEELFKAKNLERSENSTIKTKSLELLQRYRFGQGLLKSLQTEAESGIIGDEGDIKRRTKFFGANTKPLPQIPPLIESIKEALDDRILLALAIAAFFTVITGAIATGWQGAIQGISIYIAIIVIVGITSLNDWVKDKNFVKLQSELKNEEVAVIRGKYGATQSINIFDLVAGDIVLLETGSRIPADCVLIEGQDLTIDESYYTPALTRAVVKSVATEGNVYDNPDPFLLSNTLVATGSGKAVVCGVGARSRRGVLEDQLDTSSKTPLQAKLQNLAGTFTLWGIYAAALIFIANLINFIIKISVSSTYRSDAKQIIDDLAGYFTLSITIIIVAVPEGLPLAVVLSLAYSVLRMKDDGVLVKNLNAPEVMGRVEEILTGKTGTLTAGDMKVSQFYSQSLLIRNQRKNTLFNCELFPEVIELIKESILYNVDARIEMDDKAYYVPVGNSTEVGLLKFLQDAEIPIHDLIKQKLGRMEAVIPFSTIRKRTITAVRHPEREDIIRIYIKGAPELITPKCTRTFEVDGRIVPMNDEQLNYIQNDILHQKFTSQGLRCIAFAYKDLTVDQFEDLQRQYNNFQSEEHREVLENQLTFIALIALQDDLRDKVLRSVQFARRGHINVRLVSGDNLETAIATAVKAGIITDEEAKSQNACMTGEEFRTKVGGVVKDKEGNFLLEKNSNFNSIAKQLKVLGRANPLDKHILATGLRSLGKVVAVTGEGINDVDALRTADVGFAMGSGVSVAKDVADMVLTKDDFESTMMAVMWGRNIYANTRKFLQFQLTANFTALIVVFIGAVTKGTATFGVVQLLWLNLIMDTFAAVALGSEKPHPSIIKSPPIKENEQIMTITMWRQIYGVAVYIVFVMVILFFFVDNMWGLEYSVTDEFYKDKVATDKLVTYTILFNTFIYMHLFNEINCRKIGATEFNVFHNIFSNWYFIFVVGGLMVAQYFFVQVGSMTRCAPLNAEQHAFCIVIGSTVLVVAALLKLTPAELTNKMPIAVDENKPVDENNKIMAMYNQQANAKVTKPKVHDDGAENLS